jgi:hypothetical protein
MHYIGWRLRSAGVSIPPRCPSCNARSVAVVPITDPPTSKLARRLLGRDPSELRRATTPKNPVLLGAAVRYACGGSRVLNGQLLLGHALRRCLHAC